jgi:hypothetical protein
VKRFVLIVLVLVLIVIVGGAVLYLGFDSEQLGRTVLARAGARLGLELSAEHFELHLLRGLEIEGLTAHGSLPAGALDARLDRLVLRHELWPLLSRRLVVRELVLVRPRIEITETPESAPVAATGEPAVGDVGEEISSGDAEPGSSAGGLQLEIRRLRLTDGELVLRSADPEVAPTEVRGLDLALDDLATGSAGETAPAGLAGLRGRGELTVAEARLGELHAADGRGDVRIEDGHLRVTGGRLDLDAGPVRSLELDLDLTREPFGYELSLGAEPLDTGALLAGETPAETGETAKDEGSAVAGDGGFGPSHLTFEAQGRGGGLEGMQAEGTLAVDGGSLPPLPVLAAIDALVDGAGLVGAQYQPVDVELEVRGGQVVLEPFRLVAGGVTLDVRGTAVPDGPWDLWLSLGVPRRGIDIHELPHEVLDVLTDDAGRLHLPLRVSGTAERVRVVPDPDALAEATRQGAEQRLRNRIQEELGRGLHSLFGGGKSEPETEPETGGDG